MYITREYCLWNANIVSPPRILANIHFVAVDIEQNIRGVSSTTTRQSINIDLYGQDLTLAHIFQRLTTFHRSLSLNHETRYLYHSRSLSTPSSPRRCSWSSNMRSKHEKDQKNLIPITNTSIQTSCVGQALQAASGTCQSIEFSCICKNPAFISAIEPCLPTVCSAADISG
jgi:hypothetical protein